MVVLEFGVGEGEDGGEGAMGGVLGECERVVEADDEGEGFGVGHFVV